MAKQPKWEIEFLAEIEKLPASELFDTFANDWSQPDDYDGGWTSRGHRMRELAIDELQNRLAVPDADAVHRMALEAEEHRTRYDRMAVTDSDGQGEYWKGRRDEAGHWRDMITDLAVQLKERDLPQVPDDAAAIIFETDGSYTLILAGMDDHHLEEEAPEHVIVAVGLSLMLKNDPYTEQRAMAAYDGAAIRLLAADIETVLPEIEGPASAFYCAVCGKNTVDAEAGFDTCDECLNKA